MQLLEHLSTILARAMVGARLLVGRVVIRDSESCEQASQARMKRLYGLTPAESTLTLKLLDGLNIDEAAEELSISPNTARCHLRAIFAKPGVTRQTEWLRLLLGGVNPLA